jgi:DNA-binding winged helix-turn-helix (wHTH) protein/TolB-like protein
MRSYRFGLFQVDPNSGKLLRQGVPVKLQEQPLRVLCLLLERPGELVTRKQLRQSLWPEGTYVEFDGSLNTTLKRLRFALGDDADNPIFIETVPRRGYRFIAPVGYEEPSETSECTIGLNPQGRQTESDSRSSIWGFRLRPWWMRAAMAVALSLLVWRFTWKSPSSVLATRKVIAVLPLSNEGAGPDLDYLRYAIANDLVTDLTHVRSISVRPFVSTSRYGSQPADLATVGRELRVTHVVGGGFLMDKQNLLVNLELVDVALNQTVWREEIAVSPQELVALHDKLAVRTAKGLLPAINISSASAADIPTPKNEQALSLFLHSLTIPLDPGPNRLAIEKLEESVSLDGSYAPAWGELQSRYYYDFHYGNGGEAAVAKALQACKRQSELDPNWPPIATSIRAEQGDLNGAYDQAADFLRRNPNVALGHHAMSYVLRSAGVLDESDKECEAALALDPGFNGFRSCAMPFILQGNYAHAQPYIRLDAHSGFGAMLRMLIALRTGDSRTASAESNAAAQGGFRFAELVHLQLSHTSEAELRRTAAELEVDPRSSHDPEMLYFNASALSFCGQSDAALRQLRKAITGKYCSWPAMQNDPLFDPIRQRPEFGELRQAAIQCQQAFLAHRRRGDAK